jgi:hypothetical protein
MANYLNKKCKHLPKNKWSTLVTSQANSEGTFFITEEPNKWTEITPVANKIFNCVSIN